MKNTLELLSNLHGVWKGSGSGEFPTIDPFDYEERLQFDVNLAYPLIHYEQKTILLPTQEPSHWETGFIRVLDEDIIELSNAQDSGRVEVLHGKMSHCFDLGYDMVLDSILLANDARMISTKRVFKVTDNTLEYHQSMTTNTTEEPIMLHHLYAKLTKVE